MRAIVCTASIGYSPAAVSPESISASAPSNTALATSDDSARVGRGCSIIDRYLVATITGLPWLHPRRRSVSAPALVEPAPDAEIASTITASAATIVDVRHGRHR
jgi:hypothetical protein